MVTLQCKWTSLFIYTGEKKSPARLLMNLSCLFW